MIEPEDALAPGAPALHADVPGNLAIDYEYGNRAATDEAFAKARPRRAHDAARAAHRRRSDGAEVRSRRLRPPTGHFDIYMPTQGMSDIMKEFAHVTGLTPEQFRIHAKDVGGGFGVRNEVYPEFAALAFAARALGRPVKWVGTRSRVAAERSSRPRRRR